MSGGRRALLAAAAVEAAAGLAAASRANALGGGRDPVTIFVSCTLAAAAADMVLVPACVWVMPPRMPWHLLGRTIGALVTLVLTVWASVWMTFGIFALASITSGGSSPGSSAGAAVLCVPFLLAGVLVGLGAAAVDRAGQHPGAAKTRWTSHVLGGLAGVVLVLGLAILPTFDNAAASQAEFWWPLLVLAPALLVLGGGTRNVLMARDAGRSGTALADGGSVTRRAAACCAVLLVLAAAAPLVPA